MPDWTVQYSTVQYCTVSTSVRCFPSYECIKAASSASLILFSVCPSLKLPIPLTPFSPLTPYFHNISLKTFSAASMDPNNSLLTGRLQLADLCFAALVAWRRFLCRLALGGRIEENDLRNVVHHLGKVAQHINSDEHGEDFRAYCHMFVDGMSPTLNQAEKEELKQSIDQCEDIAKFCADMILRRQSCVSLLEVPLAPYVSSLPAILFGPLLTIRHSFKTSTGYRTFAQYQRPSSLASCPTSSL